MINNSEKQTWTLPETGINEYSTDSVNGCLLRKSELLLPEMSEKQVLNKIRSAINNSVYTNSECGVSIIEEVSRLDGFTGAHPYQLSDACQGAVELMFNIEHMCEDIFGMKRVSMQAISERQATVGLINSIKLYKKANKDYRMGVAVGAVSDGVRKLFKLAGFDVTDISEISDNTTAVIMTKSDLPMLVEINSKKADLNFLSVLDGRAFNSLCGLAKPSEMGFDAVYFDADDLFGISQNTGDTSCFILGANDELEAYIPTPCLDIDDEEQYYFKAVAGAAGKINTFHGDFTALAKLIGFILSNGLDGLKKISAVNLIDEKFNKQ